MTKEESNTSAIAGEGLHFFLLFFFSFPLLGVWLDRLICNILVQFPVEIYLAIFQKKDPRCHARARGKTNQQDGCKRIFFHGVVVFLDEKELDKKSDGRSLFLVVEVVLTWLESTRIASMLKSRSRGRDMIAIRRTPRRSRSHSTWRPAASAAASRKPRRGPECPGAGPAWPPWQRPVSPASRPSGLAGDWSALAAASVGGGASSRRIRCRTSLGHTTAGFRSRWRSQAAPTPTTTTTASSRTRRWLAKDSPCVGIAAAVAAGVAVAGVVVAAGGGGDGAFLRCCGWGKWVPSVSTSSSARTGRTPRTPVVGRNASTATWSIVVAAAAAVAAAAEMSTAGWQAPAARSSVSNAPGRDAGAAAAAFRNRAAAGGNFARSASAAFDGGAASGRRRLRPRPELIDCDASESLCCPRFGTRLSRYGTRKRPNRIPHYPVRPSCRRSGSLRRSAGHSVEMMLARQPVVLGKCCKPGSFRSWRCPRRRRSRTPSGTPACCCSGSSSGCLGRLRGRSLRCCFVERRLRWLRRCRALRSFRCRASKGWRSRLRCLAQAWKGCLIGLLDLIKSTQSSF